MSKFFTKRDLKKFENPVFAIVYWRDDCCPENEPPRPCWTFLHESWEITREIEAIMNRFNDKGFSHFRIESKIYDAKVFDWNEINGYLLKKYYHEDYFGKSKIKIEHWGIYHDLI